MIIQEMYRLIVFALITTVHLVHVIESLMISIDQGTINGTYLKARSNKTFNAFFRIPYAQPPVGDLRFKPPVEAEPWSGIRNGSVFPSECVQYSREINGTKGSEDCLYLNVYTPLDAREGQNLSVIVYIYGGVYKSSSNLIDGPNYIMDKNVILVQPNYRAGVLGFLSTGDIVIPGNFGLKDQLLALKWVQKNIYHFGGDPNKITLQGHSSGGVCVHLHTLSPSSKGLFQKVIIQSGNGMCALSYFGPDVTRAVAKEFAVRAGCPSFNSSQEIYECLMDMEAEKMPLIQEEMYIWDQDPDATFRPTIEDINSDQAFLTDFPQNLQYHSPDLPWIIGMTTGEAAFKVARYLENGGERSSQIDENYKLLFPIIMQYLWNTKTDHLNYISLAIRTHYFADQGIGDETAVELTSMLTEGLFGICTIDTIFSYPGQKYVYWYDYVSNYSTQNIIGDYNEYLGVSHGDEVHLLFYRDYSAAVLTEQDVMFSEELESKST
ncbi:esterase FE4-like isoform X2 [Planococcus citri]|uniref:esterase FE4-like isoform X2 n=1 Tax=Planococcus citri TaxID=170843 RepID=UPI0031F8FCEF